MQTLGKKNYFAILFLALIMAISAPISSQATLNEAQKKQCEEELIDGLKLAFQGQENSDALQKLLKARIDKSFLRISHAMLELERLKDKSTINYNLRQQIESKLSSQNNEESKAQAKTLSRLIKMVKEGKPSQERLLKALRSKKFGDSMKAIQGFTANNNDRLKVTDQDVYLVKNLLASFDGKTSKSKTLMDTLFEQMQSNFVHRHFLDNDQEFFQNQIADNQNYNQARDEYAEQLKKDIQEAILATKDQCHEYLSGLHKSDQAQSQCLANILEIIDVPENLDNIENILKFMKEAGMTPQHVNDPWIRVAGMHAHINSCRLEENLDEGKVELVMELDTKNLQSNAGKDDYWFFTVGSEKEKHVLNNKDLKDETSFKDENAIRIPLYQIGTSNKNQKVILNNTYSNFPIIDENNKADGLWSYDQSQGKWKLNVSACEGLSSTPFGISYKPEDKKTRTQKSTQTGPALRMSKKPFGNFVKDTSKKAKPQAGTPTGKRKMSLIPFGHDVQKPSKKPKPKIGTPTGKSKMPKKPFGNFVKDPSKKAKPQAGTPTGKRKMSLIPFGHDVQKPSKKPKPKIGTPTGRSKKELKTVFGRSVKDIVKKSSKKAKPQSYTQTGAQFKEYKKDPREKVEEKEETLQPTQVDTPPPASASLGLTSTSTPVAIDNQRQVTSTGQGDSSQSTAPTSQQISNPIITQQPLEEEVPGRSIGFDKKLSYAQEDGYLHVVVESKDKRLNLTLDWTCQAPHADDCGMEIIPPNNGRLKNAHVKFRRLQNQYTVYFTPKIQGQSLSATKPGAKITVLPIDEEAPEETVEQDNQPFSVIPYSLKSKIQHQEGTQAGGIPDRTPISDQEGEPASNDSDEEAQEETTEEAETPKLLSVSIKVKEKSPRGKNKLTLQAYFKYEDNKNKIPEGVKLKWFACPVGEGDCKGDEDEDEDEDDKSIGSKLTQKVSRLKDKSLVIKLVAKRGDKSSSDTLFLNQCSYGSDCPDDVDEELDEELPEKLIFPDKRVPVPQIPRRRFQPQLMISPGFN